MGVLLGESLRQMGEIPDTREGPLLCKDVMRPRLRCITQPRGVSRAPYSCLQLKAVIFLGKERAAVVQI